jgi:hypothetical protein
VSRNGRANGDAACGAIRFRAPPQSEDSPWLQDIIRLCREVDATARDAIAAQVAFDLQHPD